MKDINWPHVRQVILNDRSMNERPDKKYLRRVSRILPDVVFHAFGRFYDGTWFLVMESKLFPYHIEAWGTRGAIPATSLINYLPKKDSQ